jgi:hypothetical protein
MHSDTLWDSSDEGACQGLEIGRDYGHIPSSYCFPPIGGTDECQSGYDTSTTIIASAVIMNKDRLKALTLAALLSLLSACGGGDSGSGGAPPAPQAPDTTPDALSFASQADAARSASVTSAEITISGINAVAAVTITGGEYSIDSGPFTAAAGSITNNQKIRVRATTSAQFSTVTSTVLTVGGVSATFSVTTLAIDTTPDAFAFAAQADVARSATFASDEVTLTGINSDANVSITGGEFSIDGGAYSSAPATVRANQKIRVRVSSSAQFSTATSAVLTIGGVAGTFRVTTLAADTTPAAFQFARIQSATRGAWVNSSAAQITDINAPAPVSIVDGEYSINGGAFTSAAGQVGDGQSIVVRVRASTLYSRATRATLTVGGVSVSLDVFSELPLYVPDRVVHDGQDTVYLLSNANRMVFRWSIGEARYLDALSLPSAGATPTQMTFSASQDRLFLGYANGDITYFPASVPAATATSAFFARTPLALGGLVSVGKFLLAQDSTGPWVSHFVFGSDGAITDQEAWNQYSGEYAWDANSSRVYFFRDNTSPNDLHYEVIDQTTGQITSAGETPYHGAYSIMAPLRVSANGDYVLLGSGDIYNRTGLTWSGSLGGTVVDARWFANDSLVTLVNTGGQATLRRLDGAQRILQEQLTYAGQALRVVGSDTRMVVLVINGGTVQFHTYVPNDDSDGDGVPNPQDAFPLDRAASVDTDGDGYPDAWNPGRSQADSTSGLVLDAFAQDAACWLPAHGTGSSCNYGATIPAYVPDQVAQQGDIIYLLSAANRRVYRWSISQGAYVNPYVVGMNQGFSTLPPTHIAVSSAHQRLYLGYASGAIRYLDLTTASPVEQPLANTALSVQGLAAVGNFVLAQDNSGAWATHYIISSSGQFTERREWNYYSREYAWDPVSKRVYFFRDSQSPDDLHFEVIDQTTGQITAVGETPYHGQYGIDPPIRVSVNGQYVLLGTGDVYERTNLDRSGSIGGRVTDARWMADGSLVTLTLAGNNSVVRRLASVNLAVLEQRTFTGTPLRIVGSDGAMTVVVNDAGTVQFHGYVPSNDSDADGVQNTLDAFPLDRAASVDTDGDGYPDAWNPGRSQADSTSGLVLDAFAQDSACWLPAHGSGGVCDYSATLPAYAPDQVVQQGDIVYLLSSVNRRVYRWSISAGKYINPYVVGINQGFSILAPTAMAYSPGNQRLYLGYPGGYIRYIAVNGTSAEVPFAIVGADVTQVASAGNYVFAGADMSYVLSSSGTVTWQGGGTIIGDAAWDAGTSRLYVFTGSQWSSSLAYYVIDQGTGLVTGSGNPTQGSGTPASARLWVSVDGQRVLIGNGDLYNQSGMTWTGTLGSAIADARWMADGSLVVLTTNGSQTTLRHLASNASTLIEQRTYLGTALRVVGSDAAMAVLTVRNGTVAFANYVPNPDSDGDGVINTQDAFPDDPAAAVDTDHDGYPDAWNAGRSQADSTTGLTLDAYPQDAACWQLAHGSGGVCNPAITVPAFVPDQVVSEGNIIYLFSAANRRVYRWSMITGQYLNPYIVGFNDGVALQVPSSMATSAAHQRLYLGYYSGSVKYIDLTVANPVETPFAAIADYVMGVASVGSHVLVENGGTWATHYIYNSAGVLTDKQELTYFSSDFAWDPVNSRVYFFRELQSPGDLHYEVIDQVTGQVTGAGETPYHGTYSYVKPVRVSPDGERVLVGTGDMYLGNGLTHAGNIGRVLTDARYAPGNVLVTLDTNDLVEIRDASTRTVLASYQYLAQPLHLAVGSAEVYLVHIVGGTTAFVRLPFYDADGDTLPRWWENLYGLSDTNAADASADADGDGLSNSAEYANHSNPALSDSDADGLTDPQEVFTYTTNPALADTDGDGLSDGAEVLTHHTNPRNVDSDGDTFSDRDELLFGGDPNDVSKLAVPLATYSQDFEGSPNLALWSTPAVTDAPWALSSGTTHGGAGSLRSGVIADGRRSDVRLHGYFAAGQLRFWARVDAASCCDQFVVKRNGVTVFISFANSQWTQYTIPLTLGIYDIEFEYAKDGNSSGGADAVWIDDVTFGP